MARRLNQERHIMWRIKNLPYEEMNFISMEPMSGCWLWLLSLNNGYGQVTTIGNNSTKTAHRLFYEREYGKLAPGLMPNHKCRVRCCVNPFHMEPVSNKENIRLGDSTKLTLKQVEEIKNNTTTKLIILAQLYKISISTISNIRRGKSWL